MANYTSTKSGNFNDPATWGGSGYPSQAGDTFTVSAGHTVTVNDVYTAELGAGTINGILNFSPTTNTGLRFGNASLTINSGGELRIGTLTNPINANYTASMLWNTTVDDAYGLIVNSGGTLNICGDPNFYGGVDNTYLYSNWTSGSVIYVVGDFSSWKNGQEIYIHKGTNYSDYNTDVFKATISGTPIYDGTKTTMTIVESFPGGIFYAGGMVVNVSRNVILQKLGANTTIGNCNSNRPRFLDNYTTVKHSNIEDAIFTGFFRINLCLTTFINCSFRNGNYVLYRQSYPNSFDNCNIVSIYSYTHLSSNIIVKNSKIFSCYSSFMETKNLKVQNSKIYSNINFTYTCDAIDTDDDTYIYSNNAAICLSSGVSKAKLGINHLGNTCSNTYDIQVGQLGSYSAGNGPLIKNAKLKPTGLSLTGRNALNVSANSYILVEHINQIKDTHAKYDTFGDIIKNTSILRSRGAQTSIEVVPLSYCSEDRPVQILGKWVENNVPPSQQIRSIKIKGEGWTTFPTAEQLYFTAEYFDETTGSHTTTVQSTAVLTNNTDWFDFPITFTPAQEGKVVYQAYIKTYQSASKIYIDNALYSGNLKKEAIWSEGESHLVMNYSEWIGNVVPQSTESKKGLSVYRKRSDGMIDLIGYQGSTWRLTVETDLDLTGHILSGQVRKTANSEDKWSFDITIKNESTYEIYMSETANISIPASGRNIESDSNTYVYEIKDNTGTEIVTLMMGNLYVVPSIVRS